MTVTMEVDEASPLDSCNLKDFGNDTGADGLATLPKCEPELMN